MWKHAKALIADCNSHFTSFILLAKLFFNMDRLISIVECQPSASTSTSEIDETILQECLHKIPIWDIAKMSKESFQQFPGNQKTILTSSYCQAMNARFDGEFFSFCLVWSGLK